MKAFIPAILCAATATLSAAGADPAASDYDSFRRAAFEKYDANSDENSTFPLQSLSSSN